ncbi:MAG TPA: PIN domain nuclease [Acidimicrobiales bacterium]|nr:PIN domain nuclease [Acidimicrobiales bacterium]
MALTHLVDTSVLTKLRRQEVRRVVEPLAQTGSLARAGISDLELGFSARSANEWDQISEALGAFELIETSADHVRRARHVQRLLAAKHQRGRKVPDLLIAAAAEAHELVVLHYDADFDRIARVTGQRTQWVVPAGSVD